MKRCTVCGKEWPETAEFFPPSKRVKSGFLNRCRPCFRVYHKAWKQAHPEATTSWKPSAQQQAKWQAQEAERRKFRYGWKKWRNLWRRAKQFNIPRTIDRAWFMAAWEAATTCPVCGAAFVEPGALSRSPDRVIPALGYTADNTKIICQECNRIKQNITLPQARMLVQWLESLEAT